MPKIIADEFRSDKERQYQITIKGHLGNQWGDWLGGVTIIRLDNGDTLITTVIEDQAALFGLLKKIRDLGVPLLSVISVHADDAD